jgi:hypothetical protein
MDIACFVHWTLFGLARQQYYDDPNKNGHRYTDEGTAKHHHDYAAANYPGVTGDIRIGERTKRGANQAPAQDTQDGANADTHTDAIPETCRFGLHIAPAMHGNSDVRLSMACNQTEYSMDIKV